MSITKNVPTIPPDKLSEQDPYIWREWFKTVQAKLIELEERVKVLESKVP